MPRKTKKGLVWLFIEREEKLATSPTHIGTWTVDSTTSSAMADWKEYINSVTTTTNPTISINWTSSGIIGSISTSGTTTKL